MKKGFSIPAAPKTKRTDGAVRDKLVAAGVRNLKEFGYPGCDEKNILTDYLYSRFFMGMLEENKGVRPDVDVAIEELLDECRKAKVMR